MGGLLFILPSAGLCLFAFGFDGYRYLRAADAQTWPVATGRVERTGYREVEGRRSQYNPRRRYDPANVVTQYEALVEYSYEVNGRRYRNDRIWLIGRGWRFDHPNEIDFFVRGLRPTALQVRYDPGEPGDSALLLSSSANPGFWSTLVTLPIGLGLAWIGWKILTGARRRAGPDNRVTKDGSNTTSRP